MGAVLYPSSWFAVPYFKALQQAQGFTISLLLQLNAAAKAPTGRAVLLSKADTSWGLEWWGGSTLNFYVRAAPGVGGTPYRAVQAEFCAAGGAAAGCGSGWVPSFAYSLPMHPVHTHRDRVASLPPCCLYGAVIPIAPPLGPGRALTLPCGWNNAGAAGNELQRKPGLRE